MTMDPEKILAHVEKTLGSELPQEHGPDRLSMAAPRMAELLLMLTGFMETDKSNDWTEELKEINKVLKEAGVLP